MCWSTSTSTFDVSKKTWRIIRQAVIGLPFFVGGNKLGFPLLKYLKSLFAKSPFDLPMNGTEDERRVFELILLPHIELASKVSASLCDHGSRHVVDMKIREIERRVAYQFGGGAKVEVALKVEPYRSHRECHLFMGAGIWDKETGKLLSSKSFKDGRQQIYPGDTLHLTYNFDLDVTNAEAVQKIHDCGYFVEASKEWR
jgi:hypothetical protein